MKLFLAAGILALMGQEKKPEAPDVNFQFKVDQAIKKGLAYLTPQAKTLASKEGKEGDKCADELVLLTLIHGGVPESDPAVTGLLEEMLKRKLERTYCVSLQAMVLEEIHRVRYQGRIAQCAQFLIDNMGAKGTWRYGAPSIFVEEISTATVAPRKDVASSGGSGKVRDFSAGETPVGIEKPKVQKQVAIKKRRDGENDTDHSNMQYAALGLRACHDAGIVFEKDQLRAAQTWWREAQKEDKGAKEERLEVDLPGGKGAKPGSTVATATVMAAAQGWCYQKHGEHKAYGSMTAGAIGALCIFDYMLGEDWTRDKDVLEGLQWVAQNFSVTGNPGPHEHQKMAENTKHHYEYYLYGLERAGMLFGTETIGAHKWYREGADVLLANQGKDGKWGDGTVDTCFAILFLRRATRRLVDVATGPNSGRKP